MSDHIYPEKTIGELIDSGAISLVNGFACGEHNSSGQGVLQIRPFNVSSAGAIELKEQKHIPPIAAQGKPALVPGDIIFNNTNTKELVGKTALWDGPEGCVFSNHMTRLRVLHKDISRRYLATALHAHWLAGKSQMLARQHVAQASILGERFREITLPWLSAAEQQALARAFSALHASLLTESQVIETVHALKRAAMRELFTRGVKGEAQKETDIGSVPESWEVVWVEDNAFAISKGASPKWQGFDYVDEGVLFIRSQNVGDGFMLWEDRAFLPVQWNDKEKRSILRAGDVLINLVGASIGRCAVGGPEIEGANCNQAVCFVRLDRNKILPEFLSGFLLTTEGQRQIHGNKKDIARANLSLQDVRHTVIPKPPIEEQREIVAILDAIDRKIDLHRRKCAVLDELFKALLHKLMTGEIRVGDLDLSTLASARVAEAAQ